MLGDEDLGSAPENESAATEPIPAFERRIRGGDVVGYGAFLFLSTSTLCDSVDGARRIARSAPEGQPFEPATTPTADRRTGPTTENIEIVHVVVTNADDVCAMFGDVDDQISATLETILRTLTRPADLIGRVNRGSYSVLIDGAPTGTGLRLAQRIVRAVECYNEVRGLPWPIDVSCEVLDHAAVMSEHDPYQTHS